jgi:hypothetical protein
MNDLKNDLIKIFTNLSESYDYSAKNYYKACDYGFIIERIKKEYPNDNRN